MQPNENYRVIDVLPVEDAETYADDENLTDAQRGTAVMLSDLNGEMGDGTGTLGIYQLSGGANGPQALCETVPLDLYDPISLEQFIADKYGPGNYRLIGRIKGKKGIAGNKLITIAAPKSTGLVPYNESAQGKSDSENNLSIMLQQMNHQNQQALAMLAEKLNAPKEKGALDSLISSLKEMDADKLALIGGGAAFLFKNFFQKKDSMKEFKDMLAMTGMIKDLREDDKEESAGSLAELGQQFLGAFMGMKQAQPAPVPAQKKQAQTPVPQNAQAQNNGQILQMLNGPFKPMMSELLNIARNHGDPEGAAETVLSSVPPYAIEPFMDFIEREDSIAVMSQAEPAVLAHAVWFSELRECMLDAYFGEEETSGDDISNATGPDATGGSEPPPEQQQGGDGGDTKINGEAD